MSTEEAVELVRRVYAAFKTGDIEELLKLCAADIEWTLPAVEGLPFGGRRRGIAEVARFFELVEQAEDVLEFTQEGYLALEDRVVVTGRSRARVKTTGRVFETSYVHVFRVREGKVSGFTEYLDTAAVAEAYRKRSSARA